MQWIVISVGLSLVLTVLLNLASRAFPGAAHRLARSLTSFMSSPDGDPTSDRRVRVYVPWKAMLIGSLILTVVVNLVLWLR